ncbi:thiamine phosphate synthase [Halorubrum sp. BOL3-1]|uniref:thiamine phosphate synthase n=1 Tax=Halorubrum sp. BOL3-1 TaxID=2497325 RepID=UPI00100511B8|nr:thiamine phosphate synthase [Halorubrum sp. BOL3-1]QAU11563.1 thiamine phosphate synthase [Halorubrum sp. BOL3-1]
MNINEWQTYLVTAASRSAGRTTPDVVAAALDGGIDVVQLRDKGTSARERYETGLRLRELTAEAGTPLVVNDRIDLAAAVDADGVHLGRSDLPVAVARERLGESAVVGVSASTVDEAREAEAAGADYLGVGAVYGTDSKDVPDEQNGIGTDRIAAVAEAVGVPVIGIGGIDASNAGPVIDAGATGVAALSAITAAPDPTEATAALGEGVSDV